MKHQIKLGLRKNQYKKLGEKNIQKYKGKTYIEIYGEEKTIKINKKLSESLKGEKNPNFGGKYSHGWGDRESQKGKTIEELWGEQTANRLRKHYSESRRGKNNNMYGKPSPKGSGNGWSGWYKGWYFRSLGELSFMINVIERFNFDWEVGESKKYRIHYIKYNGDDANYFPDFVLNNKYLVEIKPKKLHNSDTNIRKKQAALEFCKNKGLKYKVTWPTKKLSFDDVKKLVDENKVQLIERYKQKLNEYEINNCRGGR